MNERSDAWPVFEDEKEILYCWTDPEKLHRVFLLLRPDEMFDVYSEEFNDSEEDMTWSPSDRSIPLFDSEEEAVEAIHEAHPWTLDVPRQQAPDEDTYEAEEDTDEADKADEAEEE